MMISYERNTFSEINKLCPNSKEEIDNWINTL